MNKQDGWMDGWMDGQIDEWIIVIESWGIKSWMDKTLKIIFNVYSDLDVSKWWIKQGTFNHDVFIWAGGITSDNKQDNKESRDLVAGVVTPIDLLNFITDTGNKENHLQQKNYLKLNSEVVEIPCAKWF
jgi:hypothetical protein